MLALLLPLLGVACIYLAGTTATLAWATWALTTCEPEARRIIRAALILGPFGPPLILLILDKHDRET